MIQVDALAGKNGKRSAVVESALLEYIAKETPREFNQRDVDIINANVDKLNEEAMDVLEYQQVKW